MLPGGAKIASPVKAGGSKLAIGNGAREMVVADVYEGWASPGQIKELRIVRVFPKTTNIASIPPIGMAGEEWPGRAGHGARQQDGSAGSWSRRVNRSVQALDSGCAIKRCVR